MATECESAAECGPLGDHRRRVLHSLVLSELNPTSVFEHSDDESENVNQRLKNHISKLITTEITRQVTIGKLKLKPSLTICISPGKRPSGNLRSHGHANPAATITSPRTISIRCTPSPC